MKLKFSLFIYLHDDENDGSNEGSKDEYDNLTLTPKGETSRVR